jgi:broad specificity phosphatase PhoE
VTTFCLVRHAATAVMRQAVSGRAPGIHLSAEGRAQAKKLGDALASLPVSAIYSSPLERSVKTATAIANRLSLQVQIRQSLTEVDYGDWTGAAFSELASIERWRSFNSFRSGTRTPGGESVFGVQARVIAELEWLRARHTDEMIALVSHAEPIRAAICFYAGIPLDLSLRIEIAPASLSIVAVSQDEARIFGINCTSDLVNLLLPDRAEATADRSRIQGAAVLSPP